jgi:hypothetical protein
MSGEERDNDRGGSRQSDHQDGEEHDRAFLVHSLPFGAVRLFLGDIAVMGCGIPDTSG